MAPIMTRGGSIRFPGGGWPRRGLRKKDTLSIFDGKKEEDHQGELGERAGVSAGLGKVLRSH